jgi:hypothetical protein
MIVKYRVEVDFDCRASRVSTILIVKQRGKFAFFAGKSVQDVPIENGSMILAVKPQ